MFSRVKSASVLLMFALAISLVPASVASARPDAATCDWAQFVADVTVPDGTKYAPGTAFTKTWRLKNIGTCTWTTSYALIFSSGNQLGAPSPVNFPISVAPGQTVDLTVNMTAPASAGHYFSYWKLRNASSGIFGIGSSASGAFWAEIYVTTAGAASYDFAANASSATWSSGVGSLPFPGTDGSASGFALIDTTPTFENGVTYSNPGILVGPNSAFNGYIQGVYPAFHVQTGNRFETTVGCESGATSCYVLYRLDYRIGSGAIRTFWSFRERFEGLVYNASISLDSLAGQDVQFILFVGAYGSATGDRAIWGNPVITGPGGTVVGTKNFDFGTASSPIASGYTRVTESTTYTSGAHGWTSTANLESRDRSAPDDLKRDFVMNASSAARVFKVDLPNGTYNVTTTIGDQTNAHDNIVVKANGATILGDVDNAAGAFAVNVSAVSVTGSSLSLEFSDAGGSDPSWVVNAVSIAPVSVPPPSGCDRAQFIADVTIPDGTVIAPGATFSKTWRLKNIGTCTWTTAYDLIFDSGAQMGGPSSAPMPTNVAPGQTVDITISLTAPTTAGTYRGYWKFRNASDIPFGIGSGGTLSWWVEIVVLTSTTTTPGTPGTPVTPEAGTVYDFASNVCAANWFSGAGALPCPGTDGDSRGWVYPVSNPHLESGAFDGRLGLLTNPQLVYNGYIQGIYPLYHVQSGDRFRARVNCEYGATSCYVVFRLDYSFSGSSTVHTLWAFVEAYEGLFYDADISLASLVGQDVKFILTVLATGASTGDRALWVAPRIYNPASIPTSTPTPTGTPPTSTPTPTGTPPTSTPTPTGTPPTSTPTPTATLPGTPISFQQNVEPSGGYTSSVDTYIAENNPNTNYSTAVTLKISDGSEILEPIMKWDISSIPGGSTITSATLRLHVTQGSGQTYNIYEMKRDWVAGEVDWTRFAVGQPWMSPGAQGGSDRGFTSLGVVNLNDTGFYSIPLNEAGLTLVQSWLDTPSTNHGLIIFGGTNENDFNFDSNEAVTFDFHPELIISYTP